MGEVDGYINEFLLLPVTGMGFRRNVFRGSKIFFSGEAEIFLNDGTGTNEDAEKKN